MGVDREFLDPLLFGLHYGGVDNGGCGGNWSVLQICGSFGNIVDAVTRGILWISGLREPL